VLEDNGIMIVYIRCLITSREMNMNFICDHCQQEKHHWHYYSEVRKICRDCAIERGYIQPNREK